MIKLLILAVAILFILSACTFHKDENGTRYERHNFPNNKGRYDYRNENLDKSQYDGYPYDKMRGKHCSPGHVKKSWCQKANTLALSEVKQDLLTQSCFPFSKTYYPAESPLELGDQQRRVFPSMG